MTVLMTLRIAVKALLRNRLRTFLTTLGIMVGIAAVLCTVALGDGTTDQIHRDLLNLGDNFVWLENGAPRNSSGRMQSGAPAKLTVDDMKAILSDVPEIARCSPQVDARVQMVYGSQNWSSTYRGVTPDYLHIRRWPVARGSTFTDADIESAAKVALVGQVVIEKLFGDDDPLDQTFRIGKQLFRVVGTLQPKGASSTGQNQDDFVLIPYTTALRNLKGGVTLDDVMCSATSDTVIAQARDHITDLIRERHRITDPLADDFNIQTPDDQIKLREDAAATMGAMLAGIASVSLVVGGVGIMNIMLVSVAERTREIGLRMAIGARSIDVQIQFMVEALLLGLLGGAAGVALGYGGSQFITTEFELPMQITSRTIVMATIFASAVGLIFGYYPARRASVLDPIEALRSE